MNRGAQTESLERARRDSHRAEPGMLPCDSGRSPLDLLFDDRIGERADLVDLDRDLVSGL